MGYLNQAYVYQHDDSELRWRRTHIKSDRLGQQTQYKKYGGRHKRAAISAYWTTHGRTIEEST